MKKRFVIVHYNTPLLTECLVRSINLFVKDAIIYIFDNSDKDPFTASYKNVLVLDNTKGQIIDFDKWLEKYPNRNKSYGRTNAWGSAKHCYSVEKCMEIINENFILLDSDILLKKDPSPLFDENYIYCGEVITQPKSTIKRLLPFMCFINTKMCIKNDIHYFNEKKMHGLWDTMEGDRYDTGGAFYTDSLKLKHKDVKLSKYITHYGHGSWDKKGEKQIETPTQWIKRNKRYWSMEKNKKVVYTCITGGYDNLIEPTYLTSDFDYVCFTDNTDMKSDVWQIKPLPKEVEGLSQIKKQRYVKINAHKVLKEYDLSIWVDGCVTVKGDLNELLKKVLKDDCAVYVPQHPGRKCIYAEADACISMKKDVKENITPQIERYKNEGFPKNYGLLQSNIMVRKHNDKDCIKLMETWFEELKNGSHRDQLSFNYASWKENTIKIIYMDKLIYKSKWFFWGHHKKQQTKIKESTVNTRNIEKLKENVNNMLKKKARLTTATVNMY